MTRFQIEFEGGIAAPADELDEAFDRVMERLVERGVVDPAVDGAVAVGDVQVSFVVDATSTEQAIVLAHDILRDGTGRTPLSDARWTAVRAELIDAPSRASV